MPSDYPVSVQIAELLSDRIAVGEYPAGSWLPTERDLASELAVSRPVIREAVVRLAGQGLIERRPGCRPVVVAKGTDGHAPPAPEPRTARPTIAAVIPQRPTYVSAHAILCGMSALVAERADGCDLSIRDTRPSPSDAPSADVSREWDVLTRLAGEQVAGIVVWHLCGEATLPALLRLHEAQVPIVYVDRHPGDIDCDYVGVDNHGGVAQSVEHLVGLGHRRIAYVTNTEPITAVDERLEGFRDALAEHGLELDTGLVYATPAEKRTDLSGAAEHLARLRPRPTAAIVLNDLHAFELIRELNLRGIRVPDDMSIVGFDDVECYSPHPGVLTTVHQPFYQMGRRALQLLLRRIDQGSAASRAPRLHVLLPTRLVVRTTTREPGA